MITEKVLLSNCGAYLMIDDSPNDLYRIDLSTDKDFLIIEVGSIVGKPSANFTHPNVALSRKTIYEFKHYRHGGGKFWTSKAGISNYLIIPKDKIALLPEKGYSWIPAEINGVKVLFNVSGGTGHGGWVDYLHTMTSISVGHKLSDIKKLAEVSIQNDEVKKTLLSRFEEMDNDPDHNRERELQRWQEMADQVSAKVKKNREKLLKLIQSKDLSVNIYLKKGYTETNGIAVEVNCSGKRIPLTKDSWEYDFSKGRCKSIIVHFAGSGYPKRVKNSQIDWVKTVKENEKLLQVA